MREKDFQTKVTRWLQHEGKTGAYELKLTKTGSLPFSALAPHQKQNLLNAKHSSIVFKIPDSGWTNPFDCFCLRNTNAFVVVQFWKLRVKHFYLIGIDEWVEEEFCSIRKSLTEERANIIGTRYELK